MSVKLLEKNLLQDITTTYGDTTKTYIAGRILEQNVNGKDCLGARLTKFIDVATDTLAFTSVVPSGVFSFSDNNRLFIFGTAATGSIPLALYSFSAANGSYAYIGKIIIALPNTAATTQTPRAIKPLLDSGTTGWKIFFATTGSVLINGGGFILNNIDLADFTPSGTTIHFATGSNQKAVYFVQNPSAAGVNHTITQAAGMALQPSSNKIFLHNGVAATHQYHWWDYSGTLDTPGQTVTITITTPGVFAAAGHGYNNNDPVALYTTGALPTGLTASVAGISQTVYFARNVTAGTFELSATSGGASIATSGTQSGVHTVRRAHGISTSLTYGATGNLPALTGTLLLVNNENKHVPTSGVNAGFDCIDFGTSSRAYRFRISDLTPGTTTLPSLEGYDLQGLDYTTATAAFITFAESVQKWVFVTNTAKFMQKGAANNSIDRSFGSLFNKYLETMNFETVNFGSPSIVGIDSRNGWLALASNTVGERGIVVMDFKSDSEFDFSYIISPVYNLKPGNLTYIGTIEALFELTGTFVFQYRTSGFASATGGWTDISTAEDINIPVTSQIQFKIAPDIANEDASTSAQIISLLLGLNEIDSMDDNWSLYQKYSSGENDSPFYVTFRLQNPYATEDGGMPNELEVAMVDDSENVVATYSTVADIANFSVSSNDGSTFSALVGVPSNTQYTLLRCLIDSPAAGKLRARIRGV